MMKMKKVTPRQLVIALAIAVVIYLMATQTRAAYSVKEKDYASIGGIDAVRLHYHSLLFCIMGYLKPLRISLKVQKKVAMSLKPFIHILYVG